MRDAIQKNALVLAGFAIACTTLVGLVHWSTKDTIAAQQQFQLIERLAQVIPKETHNNDIANSCFLVTAEELGSSLPQSAYVALKDGQPVALAITSTAPDGYSGNINMLVGISVNGTISGVRVLSHKETPGLGDKVELRKDNWILSFNDKEIIEESDPRWAVRKDGGIFDQFTGATITPRAVVKAVHRTLTYFNNNKKLLFNNSNDETLRCGAAK